MKHISKTLVSSLFLLTANLFLVIEALRVGLSTHAVLFFVVGILAIFLLVISTVFFFIELHRQILKIRHHYHSPSVNGGPTQG